MVLNIFLSHNNKCMLPVSVEKTLKLLSQKPAAMRKRESTVVTKQLLRARMRCEKLSPSCRRASACAPPAAADGTLFYKYIYFWSNIMR